MGITGQLLLAVIAIVALIVAATAVVLAKKAAQRASEAELALQKRINRLENELSAMMDGAFGVASQLQQVEMNLKDTAQRQEQLQQRDLGNLPYNEAVRMVSQGSSVGELVEHCGLSRSEAELVELLYKKSPPLVDVEQGRPMPEGGNPEGKND